MLQGNPDASYPFSNAYKRLQILTIDYKRLKTPGLDFHCFLRCMEKREAFIENGIYHVYNRANGTEQIFRNFGNYDFFLKKYHEYMDPHWETLVYCLMPTHFHFMIRVKPTLSEQLTLIHPCVKAYADFCNGYVQSFNKQHGRRGSLFMRNFKRKAVENDFYKRKLICYIHNNPVKDGYVNNAEDWHHNSFHEFHKMSEAECCNNEITKLFGTKENFLHAHIAELSPGSIDIKSNTIPSGPRPFEVVYDQMKPEDAEAFKEWLYE